MSDSIYPFNTRTSEPKKHSSRELSALERQYVLLTQDGLPLVARPYHTLAQQLEIPVAQVLAMTEDLLARGVIRRIAAVPNHYKLGYRFNGMTVWDVRDDAAREFGEAVGKLDFVSHCYLRPRHLPHWNYNLFAMVHGRSESDIEQYRAQIKQLLAEVLQHHPADENQPTNGLKSNDMLTSTRILKKTGLRLKKQAQKKPVDQP
ncbi:Lrp/AsnC family transcriptional regulator [Thalassomonas actiniarum]|uniref:siroheme decarboxylase n=1 Tax=Thalassomonas actiniarum TaxID=485447 RepID=A0AAF0C3R1_9GAMM|nr:Lrp/AsnC family transcriptional regulator [Thalassomonas actiniarum]WDE01467.1 Lrp/AsnC family transcriptional regulator [Thalassomonas actiniarum]